MENRIQIFHIQTPWLHFSRNVVGKRENTAQKCGVFTVHLFCLHILAEVKRFELLRRQSRPTGFRIRTLQPLGYTSKYEKSAARFSPQQLLPRKPVHFCLPFSKCTAFLTRRGLSRPGPGIVRAPQRQRRKTSADSPRTLAVFPMLQPQLCSSLMSAAFYKIPYFQRVVNQKMRAQLPRHLGGRSFDNFPKPSHVPAGFPDCPFLFSLVSYKIGLYHSFGCFPQTEWRDPHGLA